MLYPIKSANGHAGQFFFAYQIARVLKWPCRLIDIDIGIDAQVEVMDDDTRISTGRFVAFQIKSTEKEGQTSIYTSPEHLNYWLGLELPVFVILVDLKAKRMYFHQVDPRFQYPVTDKGRVRIDFDTTKGRFTRSSGDIFANAGLESDLKKVVAALKRVEEYSKEIVATIEDSKTNGMVLELIELMSVRFEMKSKLDHARGIATGLHVGQTLVKAASFRLDAALDELRAYMTAGMLDSWGDDRRIVEFCKE